MLFGINKPSFPSPPLPLLLVFCSYFALSHFLHFAHFAKWKWKWLLCRLRIGSFNTCPPSQHLYCSFDSLLYCSIALLIVCPLSFVILFTVYGSEAMLKGSAKIHSFTKFFHPCFLYQGQYYPFWNTSPCLSKKTIILIMLLVWRQVMQNLCSHCRQQGALPWNVSLFQALGFWGKTRK